jgi:hypothetical protein
MLEFLFGYALGSSARNSTPMSGKTVAISVLVVMAIVGMGYLMLPIMFPESAAQSTGQCGGSLVSLVEASMCELMSHAMTIGMVFLGIATVVAVGWFLLVRART